MSKLSRQKAILELLDEGPVASQEDLQKLVPRVASPTAFRKCSRNVLQAQSRSARRDRLFRPGVDADSSAPSARGDAGVLAQAGKSKLSPCPKQERGSLE